MRRELVESAYRVYGHSVLRRARRILGGEAEALDTLQEVFMGLLDRPLRFEGRSDLGTYLYAATTRRCLNRMRNDKNRDRLRAERAPELAPCASAIPPDVPLALREALALLPTDEALAAVYYYLDGMSHAEIALTLDCSRRRVGELLERLHARFGASELAGAGGAI